MTSETPCTVLGTSHRTSVSRTVHACSVCSRRKRRVVRQLGGDVNWNGNPSTCAATQHNSGMHVLGMCWACGRAGTHKTQHIIRDHIPHPVSTGSRTNDPRDGRLGQHATTCYAVLAHAPAPLRGRHAACTRSSRGKEDGEYGATRGNPDFLCDAPRVNSLQNHRHGIKRGGGRHDSVGKKHSLSRPLLSPSI